MSEKFVINEEFLPAPLPKTDTTDINLTDNTISSEDSGMLEQKSLNYDALPASDTLVFSDETAKQTVEDSQKESVNISDSIENKYESDAIVIVSDPYSGLTMQEKLIIQEKLWLSGNFEVAENIKIETSDRVPEKGIDNIDDLEKQDAVFAEIARQAEIEDKEKSSTFFGKTLGDFENADIRCITSPCNLGSTGGVQDNSLDTPSINDSVTPGENKPEGNLTSKAGFFDGDFTLKMKTMFRDNKNFIVLSIVITGIIIAIQRK